jgi:glucose/arabinose dehydrogenase
MRAMRRRFCLMLFVLALPAAAQALEPVVAARGLDHPWGLAFLPDGRMLVTDRPGRMRIVERNGRLGEPLAGVPAVAASGQGGLLDVALHPKFAHNRLVYWSFSEPGHGGAGTAVARGRLEGNRLADVQDLSNHLGKLVRLEDDGRVPADNPFVGRAGARPEIWSYGHRNIQGAALHPATGALWTTEHGPQGGDELNASEAGKILRLER